MREQFTFYRSYYEALKTLPKKDVASVVMAICAYALDETPPELSGVALSVFTLIKPTLDSGRKKAANRAGKTKSNQEQNENKTGTKEEQTGKEDQREQTSKEGEKEGEGEREVEREVENECLKESSPPPDGGGEDKKSPPPPPSGAVADYLDRVNPSASHTSLQELAEYERLMGTAVCYRAIDIALDNRSANWRYIRAILRDWASQGVKCMADVEALEAKREQSKSRKDSDGKTGNIFKRLLEEGKLDD